MEEEELHNPILPSANSVNTFINSILASLHENDNSYKHTIYHHGAELNAQMMVNDIDNWVINRKISMAIGSTIGNNHPCPLFSTSLFKL